MSTPAFSIGEGYRSYLFSVGELGMLLIEVKADSQNDAITFIQTAGSMAGLPPALSRELTGETFTLVRELV